MSKVNNTNTGIMTEINSDLTIKRAESLIQSCLVTLIINFEYSSTLPINIYLFKVNNRNYGKSCEICSKLTIKTLE